MSRAHTLRKERRLLPIKLLVDPHPSLEHLFPHAQADDTWLLANAVRFGKGLQLVNILRDLPADLRQGRCYVPAEELQRAGLTPSALLDPATESGFRPIYDPWLARAQAHLLGSSPSLAISSTATSVGG